MSPSKDDLARQAEMTRQQARKAAADARATADEMTKRRRERGGDYRGSPWAFLIFLLLIMAGAAHLFGYF